MEEEPWDELMGGSPDEDAVRQVVMRLHQRPGQHYDEDEDEDDEDVPLRTDDYTTRRNNSAPPPATAFAVVSPEIPATNSRWSQMDPPTAEESMEATQRAVSAIRNNNSYDSQEPDGGFLTNPYEAQRTRSLPIEDEEEEHFSEEDAPEYLSNNNSGGSSNNSDSETGSNNEAHKIRQDALKVLEVADDQLAQSSYSVYRTVSGGFMASSEPLGGPSGQQKKRVPSALSGLKYTASNKCSRFRDDPYATSEALSSPSAKYNDDYEYGEEDAVLDAMERRAASSRAPPPSSSQNKWSSRYSIDNTLLALSGGAATASSRSKKFLDKLDRDHRKVARDNLFRNTPAGAVNSSIFGSKNTSNFRQNFVFGHQGVNVYEQNLRTAFKDRSNLDDSEGGGGGPSSSLPPATPRRSWQDQAKRNRRRRNLMMAASVAFIVFVTLVGVLGARKVSESRQQQQQQQKQQSATTGGGPPSMEDDPNISQEELTFYVTSNVPYTYQEEQGLVDEFKTIDPNTKFLVHLGNIQHASLTKCQSARYENVAMMLEKSRVATFVLPGVEDWAKCPNPDQAWEDWFTNFAYFEDAFGHRFDDETTVARQIGRIENFAFVESGVLLIGIHVIEDKLQDEDRTNKRNADNLEWIEYMTTGLGRQARAVVVLGNAVPDGIPQNEDFFQKMSTFLHVYGKPAMYVHANSGVGGLEERRPFGEKARDILAIQSSKGGDNPLVKITVGTGTKPFVVSA